MSTGRQRRAGRPHPVVSPGAAGRRCPVCGANLSRYNAGQVCGPCARTVRPVREHAPWVFDSSAMRTALAALDLGAVVVTLRAATGMSQQELADLLPGWTQTKVGRVERGERDSLYDVRELLGFADAVGMPREALLPLLFGDPDVAIEIHTRGVAELETAGPGSADFEAVFPQGVPAAPDGGDGRFDRRTFAGRTAAATAGLLLPGWVAPPPARATEAHLSQLRAASDTLWTRDRIVGGTGLVRQAMSLFARGRAMLDHSDHSERVGRELVALCAEIGLAAGFVAYDADAQSLARGLFNESILLAESSGDALLTAQTYTTMALQSTHLGRISGRPGPAREALRLLERATAAARHEPCPRLHALIEMRKAPPAAMLGDAAAARRAIGAARRELDRGAGDSDPLSVAFVTPAEISGFEARALLDLGKPASALRVYQDALSHLPEGDLYDRSRVFYHAMVAHSLHRAGDTRASTEEALALLPAFEAGMASKRALNQLAPVRTHTTDTTFQHRFDALTASLDPQISAHS